MINSRLLTVVIPNFNGKKYLEICLNSLVPNKPDWLELIVIDGASNDGSQEIIRKFIASIDIFISEPDSGQSDALNKGINAASGKYVTWLNSDDMISLSALKTLHRYLSDFSYPWIYCDTVLIDSHDRVLSINPAVYFFRYFSKVYPRNIIGGPAAIVRADLFKENLFDLSLHYTMDIDLYCRLLKKLYFPIKVDAFLWWFRVHNDSKTWSTALGVGNPKHLKEVALIRDRYRISKASHKLGRVLVITQKLLSSRVIFYRLSSLYYRGKNALMLINKL